MDTVYTLLLIVGIIALLILLYFVYSGLLHPVKIERIESPYPKFLIAYKYSTGSYENCGALFQKTCEIAPKNNCLGIYYDNPDNTPAKELRWIVSSVLAEDDEVPDSETVKLLQENGYKLKTLPKIKEVVRSWYPYRTRVSIFLAISRVWKQLGEYIKKTEREAHPWMELYTSSEIHFIGILNDHDPFYVDESGWKKQEERKEQDIKEK